MKDLLAELPQISLLLLQLTTQKMFHSQSLLVVMSLIHGQKLLINSGSINNPSWLNVIHLKLKWEQ